MRNKARHLGAENATPGSNCRQPAIDTKALRGPSGKPKNPEDRRLSGEFQVYELKRRITNYSVTVVVGVMLCARVLAIAPTAKAQTTTDILPPLWGGKVVGGPQIANGSTWWRTAHEHVTVWSAENRLITHVTQSNPTARPTPSSAPKGTAFSQEFSQPLDVTLFTEAHGRTEIDTKLQQSIVAESGGRLHVGAMPTSPTPTATPNPVPSNLSGLAFSEDFSTPSAFWERFDHGWSGEWNAGSMWGGERNNWHADHGMMCENPNTSYRTIHLASQEQANDAAFYYCMPDGDPAKGHMMTSVNTLGYVTVWFSPKQTFHDVSKVCWDQNITDLGGGKWTTINFLTAAEYAGKTDLGYASAALKSPSSPQGPAPNGVQVFRGGMISYTNGQSHAGARGVMVSDKAARYKHCVIDNGNGTLTTTIAQPNGKKVSRIVTGNIPEGDIRIEFADDNYDPDKHFDAKGVAPNSSDLYTWHWDNIQIYTSNQRE
jgi:hypothetical protein